MEYEGTVIRPPSEAHSIILQVTLGCSHNRCTFCGAYRDKKFRIRSEQEIARDLDFAARWCTRQKTVFLADGDALVLPHERLVALLGTIRRRLGWVRRVALYANCRDILRRTPDELAELKALGLGRIYMGLESGHEKTLRAIKKGASPEEMILAGRRVRDAGIFLSVTCLLGVAGRQDSLVHARKTARVLREMQPSQAAILTLMLLEGTELADQQARGAFTLPDRKELFLELRTLLENLTDIRCQFQANHASNYFTLDGRLPRDRNRFLQAVDQALAGEMILKPEAMRAL